MGLGVYGLRGLGFSSLAALKFLVWVFSETGLSAIPTVHIGNLA